MLRGREGGDAVEVAITVSDRTKDVAGVQTRVVDMSERHDGDLVEVAHDITPSARRAATSFISAKRWTPTATGG